MEISKEKILDIAKRDVLMYDSMVGYNKKIEEIWYERYWSGDEEAIVVSYKGGTKVTLSSGKDLDEIVKKYLKDLKTVWGTESLEEFEMLLESKGF